jgi:hypothetical protein
VKETEVDLKERAERFMRQVSEEGFSRDAVEELIQETVEAVKTEAPDPSITSEVVNEVLTMDIKQLSELTQKNAEVTVAIQGDVKALGKLIKDQVEAVLKSVKQSTVKAPKPGEGETQTNE